MDLNLDDSTSSKRKVSTIFGSVTKKNKIQRTKGLINDINLDDYNLYNSMRIKSFKEMHSYLLDIKRKRLLCTEDSEWFVEKKSFGIKSDEKGEESQNVEAFKVFTKNELLGGIGTKLLKDTEENRCEILYYNYFTDLVLKNQTPNFPLVSVSQQCDLYEGPTIKINDCLLVFSELADGSAASIFPKPTKYKKLADSEKRDMIGMLYQILMGCLTLEIHGIVQGDLHFGNILYHNEEEEEKNSGKYIHYVYEKYHIYVLHMGKLWVLWDFGLMTPNNTKNQRGDIQYTSLKTDVRRLLQLSDIRLNDRSLSLEKFVDQKSGIFEVIQEMSTHQSDILKGIVIISETEILDIPTINPTYYMKERTDNTPICNLSVNNEDSDSDDDGFLGGSSKKGMFDEDSDSDGDFLGGSSKKGMFDNSSDSDDGFLGGSSKKGMFDDASDSDSDE